MASATRELTITAIETTLLRVPWTSEPPANGIMPAADREFILIHVKTAGGLERVRLRWNRCGDPI